MLPKPTRHAAVFSILLLGICPPAAVYADSSPAYSHQGKAKTDNPEWLKPIRDDIPLAWLSLPGTHDSMTFDYAKGASASDYRFYLANIVKTQSLSLKDQLESGVRVLDIRVAANHSRTRFSVHHGPVDLGIEFGGGVLDPIKEFLKAHPSETVLMRLKNEGEGGSAAMNETFPHYADNREYRDLFWQGGNADPRLREVRGKIVVMADWDWKGIKGIGMSYDRLWKQDNYDLHGDTTVNGFYRKWLAVKHQLRQADKREKTSSGNHVFYINYLSANVSEAMFKKAVDKQLPILFKLGDYELRDLTKIRAGALPLPWFVASGHAKPDTNASALLTGVTTADEGLYVDSLHDYPRVKCLGKWCSIAYEGTNLLAYDRIRDRDYANVGMVMADFPGPGLIGEIIELNIRYQGEPVHRMIPRAGSNADMTRHAKHLFPRPEPNWCLSGNGRDESDPYVVFARNCRANSKYQRWDIQQASPGANEFRIVHEKTGGCLSDDGGGGALRVHKCSDAEKLVWVMNENDSIQNKKTRRCLALSTDDRVDTPIYATRHTCKDGKAQRIYVTREY